MHTSSTDMATSGVLALTAIEARLTRDTEAIGKMDPFVRITYGQQQFKTIVKDEAGKNPVWNETFQIDVRYIGDELKIEVIDEDVLTDDKVGEAKIKLYDLCV